MKKKIKYFFISIFIFLLFNTLFVNVYGLEENNKDLKEQQIEKSISTEIFIQEKIQTIVKEKGNNNLEQELKVIQTLKSKMNSLLEKVKEKEYKNIQKKEKIIGRLNLINQYLSKYEDLKREEIKKEYHTTKKITIGYTAKNTPIIAYYKGNPNKDFFGIFSNIHGGYEYGTYKTAIDIKEALEKTNKEQWFIIPSINPDGLNYAKEKGYEKEFYIEGRSNSRGVDLNRNFCTKSFELKEYIKYAIDGTSKKLKTAYRECNSENESKAIANTLNKYKFNHIISLHSQGGLFYIPTNSFEDKRIINFGKELKKIFVSYDFNPKYNYWYQKLYKTKKYEINNSNNNYSGTMEDYIYEKYNIPIVLIELKKHGGEELLASKLTKLIDIN